MPTKREREYYQLGFADGMKSSQKEFDYFGYIGYDPERDDVSPRRTTRPKPKRKLSAWNKYVKANSKKPRFRYRNGKLNLKKMAVAFRKTPAGKKKRR